MRDPITGQRLSGIPPAGWQPPRLLVADQVNIPDATVIDNRFPDFSSWDAGSYNAACFASTGISRAMVQEDSNVVRALEENAGAGIVTEIVYAFPYLSHATTQPQRITAAAIQRALDNKIQGLMFDVELDNGASPPSVADRIRQTDECIKMIVDAGLSPWIYSAPWYWVPMLGNDPRWYEMGVRFMLANYGRNDGTMAPIREIPGFAWPYCHAHQYWSLANYCGREARDMSYLWSDAFGEDPANMGMTDDQLLALFSGSEDHDEKGVLHTREERLANARYRVSLIASGQAPSVAEVAASAQVVANQKAGVSLVPHHHPATSPELDLS